MYCRWIFFWLNMKKFIRLLPAIVLETILFGLLLLGVGTYASKAVYGEKAKSGWALCQKEKIK